MVEGAGGASSEREVAPDEARETIAGLRREPEPWQRADETVARVPDVRALAVEGGAALYRFAGGRAPILQLPVDSGRSPNAARELLAAILADADATAWVNV